MIDHTQLQTDFGFSCDSALWSIITALNYCGLKTTQCCQGNLNGTNAYIVFDNISHATWLMEKLQKRDQQTYLTIRNDMFWEVAWPVNWDSRYITKVGVTLRFPFHRIEYVTDLFIRTLVEAGVLSKTMFNIDNNMISCH